MKLLVREEEKEGLMALLGKKVTLFCSAYIYTGTLVGVNDKSVKLEDAGIVYETGPLCYAKWKNKEALPKDWYVTIHSIESFGELK